MEKEDDGRGDIIIIKRVSGDHDSHHGGAWKIAFADFMTAMMAFFLVMWLINSSSEETKKAVASYFNPIKLMDKTSNPRGIRDPKYGQPSEVETEDDSTVISSQKRSVTNPTAETSKEEVEMFADPYSVLSEIAGGAGAGTKTGESDQGRPSSESKNLGISGGEAFHDPFDPSSWSVDFEVNAGLKEQQQNGIGKIGDFEKEGVPLASKSDELKSETEKEMEAAFMQEKALKEIAEGGSVGPEETSDDKEMEEARAKLAEQLVGELQYELKAYSREIDYSGPEVTVENTSEGVLIRLADDARHGMFKIGSARPSKDMVNMMAKIGELIAGKPGKVAISGHTDSRQYRSQGYDNWRLSTARAHMAHYMLIKGGLNEDRVARIEGHADAKLKIPDDSLSASNRRIEILLKVL
ncbi:MAG: MotB family protein [Rhizobiaceae bacterium]|nr:MotB family protein [Rhizobiaceae bacterium]